MEGLFHLCLALSAGLAMGMVGSVAKRFLHRKTPYTEKQTAGYQKLWKMGSRILTFFTGLLLMVGFVWCAYFLILGAVEPAQAEYAGNMAGLIVSVLTVISIMFAFYEFLRRK